MKNHRAKPPSSQFAAGRGRDIVQSCVWFFLVLFAYYLLKPVRDGFGSALAANLDDLYLAVFSLDDRPTSDLLKTSRRCLAMAIGQQRHSVFCVVPGWIYRRVSSFIRAGRRLIRASRLDDCHVFRLGQRL